MRWSSRERIVRHPIGALALTAAAIIAPPAAIAGPAGTGTPPTGTVTAAGALTRILRPASSPAPGRLGVEPVDVPAAQAANPRTLGAIIGHVRPGAAIRRRLLIANHGGAVAHVAIYPDAAVIRDGAFLGSAGRARSDLTAWTTTSRQRIILAPHAAAKVAVTIAVPPDASPGERYGVIFAQETSRLPVRSGFAINEVSRVGVRIYLLVGRGDAPQTDFAVGPLRVSRPADGPPLAAARVTNTGRRAVDLSGNLTLYSVRGVRAGPFATQLGTTLAPGQSGQVEMDLANWLPGGVWRARLVLVSGLTRRRVAATVRVGGAPGSGTGIRFASRYLIAAMAAVILLVLFVSLARRRRHWDRLSHGIWNETGSIGPGQIWPRPTPRRVRPPGPAGPAGLTGRPDWSG